MVYADVFRPAVRRNAWVYDLALVLAGSLFIAISAQLAVLLPWSPVPVTGQTLAVLLVGALLGSRRGSLAVLTYIAEGALGMPVFAGGAFGLARLFGPTGGYLLGFVLAAALVGWLAEQGWDRRVLTTAAAMALGNLAIYVVGVLGLSAFVGGIQPALAAGVAPFIVGDIFKLTLAAFLLPGGWAALRWLGFQQR